VPVTVVSASRVHRLGSKLSGSVQKSGCRCV
jgi:hypothetical protein